MHVCVCVTVICICIFLYMHICKNGGLLLGENKGASQKGRKDGEGKKRTYIS